MSLLTRGQDRLLLAEQACVPLRQPAHGFGGTVKGRVSLVGHTAPADPSSPSLLSHKPSQQQKRSVEAQVVSLSCTR